ncbi:MAG: YbaK/EbsC family protein [Microlunatus sp.]
MSTAALHPSAEKINAILVQNGLAGRVRILANAAPTAQAAADQIGCPVGAIANSLVFATAEGTPLLVMTSGIHRVNLRRLGSRIGTTIKRADAEFVRTHTSQPIGGVAPFGHPRHIRTIIDVDLAAHDLLWAGGGIPHAVFPLTYADLVALTEGEELPVA